MKKIFVEPQMVRIELNMDENIATSDNGKLGLILLQEQSYPINCYVQHTGVLLLQIGTLTEEQINSCMGFISSSGSKSRMAVIPKSEIGLYYNR